MNQGYCIIRNTDRIERKWIDMFADIPVPNIGDAMNRTAAVGSSIKPLNKVRMMGTAYTVRVQAGDNLLFYYAIAHAEPGDIIVVDGAGYEERALCGEIMAAMAEKRGLAGFVVNGAVRDRLDLQNGSFPVFARAVCPNGPYKNGPGEINVPVNIAGRVIHPGDVLIGDSDGIVVIPPKDVKEVLQKARMIVKKEAEMMRQIDKHGELDLSWVYEKLKLDNCEII